MAWCSPDGKRPGTTAELESGNDVDFDPVPRMHACGEEKGEPLWAADLRPLQGDTAAGTDGDDSDTGDIARRPMSSDADDAVTTSLRTVCRQLSL